KRSNTIELSDEKLRLVTDPIKQKLRLLGINSATVDRVLKTRTIEPTLEIVAPENGVVSERLINVGELADPGKPLFTIGDYDTLWLKAEIYEKDIPKIQLGQPIELEVDSFPGEKFVGKLNYIADSIDTDTRTLTVRAEVPNPGLKLKPKMFGRMRIIV